MTTGAQDLTRALEAADPEVRRLAVQGLPDARGVDVPRLLLRALGDDDWRVRKEAAACAPRLAPRDAVLAALADALSVKEDIGLRNAAVEALTAVGTDALAVCIVRGAALDADGRKLLAEVFAGIPDARSVSALSRMVKDEDPNVRAAAAEGLGRAGLASAADRDVAISALTAALGSGDVMTTLAALDALAHLDAKLPWRFFAPFADQPVFRRHAVLAAARSREEAALVALLYAVGDRVTAVSHDATLALASWLALEPPAADVTERARSTLKGAARSLDRLRELASSEEDRRLAAASLVVMGLAADPRDVPRLVDAVGDEELTDGAVLGLELFGESCVPRAVASLERAAPRATAIVLSMASRLARRNAPELVVGLRRALGSDSADVLRAAILGLGEHGGASDLPSLAPLARHADESVAFAAVSALGALARLAPEAARVLRRGFDPLGDDAVVGCALSVLAGEDDVAFLERAVAHRDPRTRRVAIEAFGSSPGADPEPVVFALTDEERDVRLAAIRTLGQMGRAEPLAALVATSDDVELVVVALRALGEADRARGFAAARPLVSHREPAIACAGVEAVDRFGDGASREDALFEALAHADVEVVKLALASLSKSLDARALIRLGMALDHESWEVRRLASDLLGRNKEPAAQAMLRARLELERETVVREALARALSVRPPSGFEGGG